MGIQQYLSRDCALFKCKQNIMTWVDKRFILLDRITVSYIAMQTGSECKHSKRLLHIKQKHLKRIKITSVPLCLTAASGSATLRSDRLERR